MSLMDLDPVVDAFDQRVPQRAMGSGIRQKDGPLLARPCSRMESLALLAAQAALEVVDLGLGAVAGQP
jgi:hypothetical protein